MILPLTQFFMPLTKWKWHWIIIPNKQQQNIIIIIIIINNNISKESERKMSWKKQNLRFESNCRCPSSLHPFLFFTKDLSPPKTNVYSSAYKSHICFFCLVNYSCPYIKRGIKCTATTTLNVYGYLTHPWHGQYVIRNITDFNGLCVWLEAAIELYRTFSSWELIHWPN